ncbi:MAG: acyl-CoA thioesterase [Bacillota bacterium]|nr:acyl-CoA thioesterase [Bacillota bacterium]
MDSKKVSESCTEIAQFMLPGMANPLGSIHGGEIMKMLDNTAVVCGMRHCNGPVVTISVDNINFFVPIYSGELAVSEASVVYVGKTSMEIEIQMYVENIVMATRKLALIAYFSIVAIDSDFKPFEVPRLELSNETEEKKFAAAEKRLKQRKTRLLNESK